MSTWRKHREAISKLMYYHFHRVGWIYLLFVIVLIALPLIALMGQDFSYFQRGYYNDFLLTPFAAMTFPVLLILWILYSIFDLKRLSWKYNVQDRELILPLSRMDLLLADVLFLIASFYIFYFLQTLVYYLGYQIYTMKGNGVELLHNGFFLSIYRTPEYTELFLPITLAGFIKQLLLTMTCSLCIVSIGHFGFKKNKLTTLVLIFMILMWGVIYFYAVYNMQVMATDYTKTIMPNRFLIWYNDYILYRGYYRYILGILCIWMVFQLSRHAKKKAW